MYYEYKHMHINVLRILNPRVHTHTDCNRDKGVMARLDNTQILCSLDEPFYIKRDTSMYLTIFLFR